jgi:hypothetical protein
MAFQLCFRICHQVGSGKEEGLKLNGTHHFLVYAILVNIVKVPYIPNRKTQTLIFSSKEISLEFKAEETKYVIMSQ